MTLCTGKQDRVRYCFVVDAAEGQNSCWLSAEEALLEQLHALLSCRCLTAL